MPRVGRGCGSHTRRGHATGTSPALPLCILVFVTLSLQSAFGADTAPATKSPGGTESGAQVVSDARPQYWFGVAVENLPPAVAEHLKLRPDQGVMVSAVFENSPAAKAGLLPKDLLIELNGQPLTSQEELAIAKVDADCRVKTKYQAITTKVRDEAQQRFLDEHPNLGK